MIKNRSGALKSPPQMLCSRAYSPMKQAQGQEMRWGSHNLGNPT
jgi:hypothetical protein